MVRLVIDSVTRQKLQNLDQPIEFCDESGRLLGHFSPADQSSLYEELASSISLDELDRRSRAGGGRPLAEILSDLESQT